MTRKDYELISRVFARTRGHQTPTRIANALADALGAENPRFDRARFLEACGVQDLDCNKEEES